MVRAEARTSLGEPWRPSSGGHKELSGGRVYWEWERISGQGAGTVRMRSAGNQRLRVWLPASAAAAAAVRVRVAWRRPWGAVAGGAARPLLRVYRGRQRVRHAVLLAAEDEEARLLFGPALGEGEYTVYFLSFTARWDAHDAQHDLGSTRCGESEHIVGTTWQYSVRRAYADHAHVHAHHILPGTRRSRRPRCTRRCVSCGA